jgi:hypothetical protein
MDDEEGKSPVRIEKRAMRLRGDRKKSKVRVTRAWHNVPLGFWVEAAAFR